MTEPDRGAGHEPEHGEAILALRMAAHAHHLRAGAGIELPHGHDAVARPARGLGALEQASQPRLPFGPLGKLVLAARAAHEVARLRQRTPVAAQRVLSRELETAERAAQVIDSHSPSR